MFKKLYEQQVAGESKNLFQSKKLFIEKVIFEWTKNELSKERLVILNAVIPTFRSRFSSYFTPEIYSNKSKNERIITQIHKNFFN